jgi:hypothetical protein
MQLEYDNSAANGKGTVESSTSNILPFEPPSERDTFVMLRRELINSPAWQSLRPEPRALYVEVANQFNGRNNGRIRYSVRDAITGLHVGQATVYRAFNSLQERGFLIPHMTLASNGHAIRRWELTDFALGGDAPSRDYLAWRTKQ